MTKVERFTTLLPDANGDGIVDQLDATDERGSVVDRPHLLLDVFRRFYVLYVSRI